MNPEHARRLGRLIRNRRQALGLSTRQLEEIGGVSDSVVVKLENGQLKHPTIESLEKLATALELPMEDILATAGLTRPGGLPSFKPYLRAKYGHLPASKRDELAKYFEAIEAEYGAKANKNTQATKRTKGGRP